MDLKQITKATGLKVRVVAAAIWPDVKHPLHAYYHHVKIGGQLNESQLIALSRVTGIPVDVLLGFRWSGKISPRAMLLSSGRYTIEYTSDGPKFRIIENGYAIGEHTVSPGMPVSVFLETVEKEIITHINNTTNGN